MELNTLKGEKKVIKTVCVSEMKEPVIYCLKQEGEIVYIGQSTNFMGRFAAHLSNPDKVFDTIEYYVFNGDLNKEEMRLIKKYKPKYNGTGNPDYIPIFKSRVIIDPDNRSMTLFIDVDKTVTLTLKRLIGELDNYDIFYNEEKVGEYNYGITSPRTSFYIKFNELYYYRGKHSKTKNVLDDNYFPTSKVEILDLFTTKDVKKVCK